MYKAGPESHFTLAEKTGALALLFGLILLSISSQLTVLVLTGFLLLCTGAPFFTAWSFYLPVVSRGPVKEHNVALTFDDGPSPSSTPLLLEMLARHGLQATFFLIGEKAANHPELIQAIVQQGHTIGNHSWRHDPLLMLRSTETILADVRRSQELFQQSGISPLAFRPPAGITGPRLHRVMEQEGLFTITFSIRAFDRGNKKLTNLAEKILHRLHPGGIIMLHDVPPRSAEDTEYWQAQLETIFTSLKQNYTIVSLDALIGLPVMKKLDTRIF